MTEYPYLLFWDWNVTESTPVEIACFSQWFPRDFVDPHYAGCTFKTAEHYMMYSKALLFDPPAAKAILDAPTPAEAKSRGRQIRNFDKAKWNSAADDIVERGNYMKFSQHEDMKGWVLDTDKTLVECNPDDRIWGIGFSVEEARGREKEWGQNRMGLALTRARDRICNGEKPPPAKS